MVKQYSRLVYPSPPGSINLYCGREADGKLNFIDPYGYGGMQTIYDKILRSLEKDTTVSADSAIIAARDSMIVYLRDHWKGDLDSLYAQTRIASSYGLLQVLYVTATEKPRKYEIDNQHIPENLNTNYECFTIAMKYHKYNLQTKVLGKKVEKGNNWSIGYEDAFEKMFEKYNPDPTYPGKVMSKSQRYLPKD